MQCPSCGFENPEGMNFCGKCATPLLPKCPQCGFENPAGFAFCGKCATPLTTSTTAPSFPRTPQQPATQLEREPASYTPQHLAEKILTSRSVLESERKQVTVMFADIKDSTELIAASLLQQQGKLTYRTLKRQFDLNDEALEDLKDELLFSHPVVDQDGRGLVWTDETETTPVPTSQSAVSSEPPVAQEGLSTQVTPPTAEPPTPDAERPQLTMMFCDLADSTSLSGQLDPEDSRDGGVMIDLSPEG